MKIVDIVQKYESSWLCVLFVNDKSAIGDDIEGLPSNIDLAPGSMIYTGALEIGVYKEDGTWGWK